MSLLTFKKVRCARRTGADTIRLTLFRDSVGRVCGWFIGPVQIKAEKVDIPYLPESDRTLGAVAVVRAMTAADDTGCPLCVVDPDDLWEPAWAA